MVTAANVAKIKDARGTRESFPSQITPPCGPMNQASLIGSVQRFP